MSEAICGTAADPHVASLMRATITGHNSAFPRRHSLRRFAPRNDVNGDAPPTAVILPEGGVSSTPRVLVRSQAPRNTGSSAFADDDEHGRSRDAFSPEFCKFVGPQKERGRREDRVHAAPTVSCAKGRSKNAHEHTGSAETLRPSLRNGFTAYIVLSPVRPKLACHRRSQEA
jgi:hypothetical protein